jgi:hypothetical protein
MSTTICWPSLALKSAARMRAVRSGPPPAPKGTMNRIGRVGYCAAFGWAANAAPKLDTTRKAASAFDEARLSMNESSKIDERR